MIKIKKKATLPVPPSEVFAFLCDPDRMRRLSSRWEVDEVVELPGGLHRTRAHLTRRDGVVLHHVGEGIEKVPDTRVVVRSLFELAGDVRLERLATHTLAPTGDGTLMKSRFEFRVQPGHISRLDTPRHYRALKKGTAVNYQRLIAAIADSCGGQTAPVNAEPEKDDGST